MNLLIEKETYLAAGVHLGTTVKNEAMKRFIYKILPNGLAVFDLDQVDSRIRIAAKFLSRYENVLVVSRKYRKPIESFAKSTGATPVIGRFLPGMLTNPNYGSFLEPDVVLVSDPFIDRQALVEASKAHIPVVALCNTFNSPSYVDLVIPCNNRGRKSVAVVFYLLAREILRERKEEEKLKNISLADFIEKGD